MSKMTPGTSSPKNNRVVLLFCKVKHCLIMCCQTFTSYFKTTPLSSVYTVSVPITDKDWKVIKHVQVIRLLCKGELRGRSFQEGPSWVSNKFGLFLYYYRRVHPVWPRPSHIPPLWVMCLESVAHLLVMLNFSTNFIIYCSVSAPFKRALSKVIVKLQGMMWWSIKQGEHQ